MVANGADHIRRLLAEGALAAAREFVAAQQVTTDASALAEIALACLEGGSPDLAESTFRTLIILRPDIASAHTGLASALMSLNRPGDASRSYRRAILLTPNDPSLPTALARALMEDGRVAEAAGAFEEALRLDPCSVAAQLGYGHALRALGRSADAVAAYRCSLSLAPGLGEAWWSLANLKTFSFDAADRLALAGALEQAPNPRSRALLLFALAKSLDDAEEFARAFAAYEIANATVRSFTPYNPYADEQFAAEIMRAFSPALMRAHDSAGDPDPSPIFVVGLPRAGSTLIEQILASHSDVEGLGELPFLAASASGLGGAAPFPRSAAGADAQALKAAGGRYIGSVGKLRSGRARFVDKMPNNFFLAGFAMLALPRATIIDARRNPLDVAVSAFRQYFSKGQDFSYSMDGIAAYHRIYSRLMSHWDLVAPGRVVRVCYEQLIQAPEVEIRRLLDACGLSFEPQCLDFHQTSRAIRTASSEQVRLPLYRTGVGSARRYGAAVSKLESLLHS